LSTRISIDWIIWGERICFWDCCWKRPVFSLIRCFPFTLVIGPSPDQVLEKTLFPDTDPISATILLERE
jgi:hypothetical protein